MAGGRRARSLPGDPFTLRHFAAWAGRLILDTEEAWVLQPFQELFFGDLFERRPDGLPLFNECWQVVPEGNGKTTSIAGLSLYHIRFRRSGRVPWAASARDQAELGYSQAAGFVERSPSLRGQFKCLEGYRRIRCDEMGSRIQVFAADERTGDGIIPTLPICDELHRHKNLGLYRTWSGKLEKRGGQLVAISTAGEPGSEFEETREAIRQGAIEVERDGCFLRAVSPGIVLHEYAVPDDGDVEDLELVKEANPFSAITVETLRAKRAKPTMTAQHWARFTCNVPTRDVRSAITEGEWAKARTDERIPEGSSIWAGLDVAFKWDTTALVPLLPAARDRMLFGPATILEPPRDGSSLDPHLVEEALITLHELTPIDTLVMDASRAEQLAAWAEEELGCRVIDRQQTNTLAAVDYERFMGWLRQDWLAHSGDPGLARHVLNAIARMLPGGQTRFDRPVQSRRSSGQQDRRVIDGLTAASMVLSTAVAELFPDDEEESLAAFVFDPVAAAREAREAA